MIGWGLFKGEWGVQVVSGGLGSGMVFVWGQ